MRSLVECDATSIAAAAAAVAAEAEAAASSRMRLTSFKFTVKSELRAHRRVLPVLSVDSIRDSHHLTCTNHATGGAVGGRTVAGRSSSSASRFKRRR